MPNDCDAVIDTKSWKAAIFQILERHGRVEHEEMYQVFYMGIGMAAIVSPNDAESIGRLLRARPIGRVERGRGVVLLLS